MGSSATECLREGGEDVVKTCSRAKATTAGETRKARSSPKWVTGWTGAGIGIEPGCTKLVELLLLLRIRQDFICGLDIGKLVLGRVILVRIWVIFLGKAVVRLLDLRGGGIF